MADVFIQEATEGKRYFTERETPPDFLVNRDAEESFVIIGFSVSGIGYFFRHNQALV